MCVLGQTAQKLIECVLSGADNGCYGKCTPILGGFCRDTRQNC